jgi:hypothetical protein
MTWPNPPRRGWRAASWQPHRAAIWRLAPVPPRQREFERQPGLLQAEIGIDEFGLFVQSTL